MAPAKKTRWVKKGKKKASGWKKTGKVRKGFSKSAVSSKIQVNQLQIKDLSGRPEMEKVRLRYATTSAFTVTGGVASYLKLKLNSLYQPWGTNTDSAGGTATMFSLYRKCMVYASKVDIRLWADTSGNSEPFRAVICPVTPTQYTGFSGATNIVTLFDSPNFKVARYAPGDKLLHLSHSAYVPQVERGVNMSLSEMLTQNNYSATSGTDPSSIFNYIVGFQNFAGTTTLDAQVEGIIEFDCVFYEPISTNMLQ